MNEKIEKFINDSIDAKKQLLVGGHVEVIGGIAEAIVKAYKNNKKLLVFGNGGSAADSQHFAAELVSRFELNRKALAAVALTTDTSIITATGNDFSFEDIFSRQVEALAGPGDVVIGITTSGNSPNVIKAVNQAKAQGAFTIGFTGGKECKIKGLADICFCAPAQVTARVQECHGLAIHIICSLVETELFSKN
jgi:D-sedoheptulose 7-phosphate isomerase